MTLPLSRRGRPPPTQPVKDRRAAGRPPHCPFFVRLAPLRSSHGQRLRRPDRDPGGSADDPSQGRAHPGRGCAGAEQPGRDELRVRCRAPPACGADTDRQPRPAPRRGAHRARNRPASAGREPHAGAGMSGWRMRLARVRKAGMPDLIHRARQRLLSRAELDEIAAKLEYQETFDELSDQLLAMQLAGDARYRRAVERYLSFRGRVTAAARALRVLCFDWKLTEDYFEWLIGFIEGVDWDLAFGTPEVRTQAFHLAGYHLQSTRSRRLLGLLVQVAEDPCEQPSNRGDAGRALMSAAGVPAREVPLELSTADPGWARAVRDARDRLRSEPEPPPTVERRPMPRLVQLPDYVGEFLPDPEAESARVERARRNQLPQAELSAGRDALRRRGAGPAGPRPPVGVLFHGPAGGGDAGP